MFKFVAEEEGEEEETEGGCGGGCCCGGKGKKKKTRLPGVTVDDDSISNQLEQRFKGILKIQPHDVNCIQKD